MFLWYAHWNLIPHSLDCHAHYVLIIFTSFKIVSPSAGILLIRAACCLFEVWDPFSVCITPYMLIGHTMHHSLLLNWPNASLTITGWLDDWISILCPGRIFSCRFNAFSHFEITVIYDNANYSEGAWHPPRSGLIKVVTYLDWWSLTQPHRDVGLVSEDMHAGRLEPLLVTP